MSIRHGLLALLERGPMYGYQLRAEFEGATGGTWPLNVGQVYTTLARLDRDGLVAPDGEPDDAGRVVYRITGAGRGELAGWFGEPIEHEARPRDEVVIKLAMAVGTPGVDPLAVLDAQRTAAHRAIRTATRRKAAAGSEAGPGNGPDRGQDDRSEFAAGLVAEAAIFAAEAEVRWLDHCEALIRARTRGTPPHPGPRPDAPPPDPATPGTAASGGPPTPSPDEPTRSVTR